MRIPLTNRGRWSPEKAYLLGLLASRVSLDAPGGGRKALEVASADLPLLYWLKTVLNSRVRVARRRGLYRLRLTNQRLLAGLVRIGASDGFAALLDRMGPDLRPHLVRGYFDSRGKVSLVRVSGVLHLRSFIPGLPADIEALVEALKRHARIGGRLKARGDIRALVLDSQDSLRLHDWMYRSACFYLENKKAVFERFVAQRALAREKVGA